MKVFDIPAQIRSRWVADNVRIGSHKITTVPAARAPEWLSPQKMSVARYHIDATSLSRRPITGG